MQISTAIEFFAQLKADPNVFPPSVMAIILLANQLVDEGIQFDWDHIAYQANLNRKEAQR